ncbi:hypothetical protein QG37_00798 [Candidozyma auris]|nr:hypothetical protein QG37_00798 [[Candida] auris]
MVDFSSALDLWRIYGEVITNFHSKVKDASVVVAFGGSNQNLEIEEISWIGKLDLHRRW